MLNLLLIRRCSMIKREFWEKIADVWGSEEEIILPDIIDVGLSDSDLDEEEIEDLDDFIGDLFE